jgi:predicted nucleotidyltransferase
MAHTHAHFYWRRRFAVDGQALAQRRDRAVEQAERLAAALVSRWPLITQVWLFGSVQSGGFRDHSDLDLLVEGLPAGALIEALVLGESAGPLAVDLKRTEDLSPELRRRLLRRSRSLLPMARGDAP